MFQMTADTERAAASPEEDGTKGDWSGAGMEFFSSFTRWIGVVINQSSNMAVVL